jgi:uncharacterized protein
MKTLRRLGAADIARVMATYRDALQQHREALNRLNVYPVPDGDTGTNMALTLESVVAELAELDGLRDLRPAGPQSKDPSPKGPQSKDPQSKDPSPKDASSKESQTPAHEDGVPDMAAVCKAIAHGSLMGARGNSGVILSQLLRGLTGVLESDEHPGARELAEGLDAASRAAFKAVLRPVEGTILTVARAAAEGAESSGDSSLLVVLEHARSHAADALARTPELLPVLAQAGVVDAGGGGYVLLLDSMLFVVGGREIPKSPFPQPQGGFGSSVLTPDGESASLATPATRDGSFPAEGPEWQTGPPGQSALERQRPPDALISSGESAGSVLRSGLRYEVMYFLEASDESVPGFKDVWEGIGDSIVVVGGDGLWNCHIHTNDVGAAIEAALDVGRPRDIRVSDLAEQIDEERWVREGATSAESEGRQQASPPVRTAVVAVANGEGIGRIFWSLGVHHLVPGGQSMNPSTAQILEVLDLVASEELVILPNNENIIPVAMQAAELAHKTVRVVPTCGIVEGFAALLEYDPQAGAEENAASMSESARRVLAGEVTRAVRDSVGPVGAIHAGDWMGMSRDGVEVVASSLSVATCELLDKLLQDGHELVTLIEGEGAVAGETRQVTEWLAERHSQVAVEVHHGGQPLYPYLLSIE